MKAVLTLLAAAAIWGFAFVAQRKGMASLDPFTFNALRFILGAACVWLTRLLLSHTRISRQTGPGREPNPSQTAGHWMDSLQLGGLLFIASSLQQYGLLWTGAGRAGFITGLYVVMVPLIGLLRGQHLNRRLLLSVGLAVAGLWLINRSQSWEATQGNFLVLTGALFWALHVQLIDKLTVRRKSLDLALGQYLVCAVLSLAGAILYRGLWGDGSLPELALGIRSAILPLLYAGLFSVGIAFTLQLHAQKKVAPTTASVILCSESLFALLGGYLLLREAVTPAIILGAALLLAAMLASLAGQAGNVFLIDKKAASEK